jgi:hypothetical protein
MQIKYLNMQVNNFLDNLKHFYWHARFPFFVLAEISINSKKRFLSKREDIME